MPRPTLQTWRWKTFKSLNYLYCCSDLKTEKSNLLLSSFAQTCGWKTLDAKHFRSCGEKNNKIYIFSLRCLTKHSLNHQSFTAQNLAWRMTITINYNCTLSRHSALYPSCSEQSGAMRPAISRASQPLRTHKHKLVHVVSRWECRRCGATETHICRAFVRPAVSG